MMQVRVRLCKGRTGPARWGFFSSLVPPYTPNSEQRGYAQYPTCVLCHWFLTGCNSLVTSVLFSSCPRGGWRWVILSWPLARSLVHMWNLTSNYCQIIESRENEVSSPHIQTLQTQNSSTSGVEWGEHQTEAAHSSKKHGVGLTYPNPSDWVRGQGFARPTGRLSVRLARSRDQHASMNTAATAVVRRCR